MRAGRSACASCARSSTSCGGTGTSARRLGVLGGTFNPPTVAHLLLAQEACEQLALDEVVLMPVFAPPHKEAEGDPGPRARLEMCRRAACGDERLSVSELEIRRGGASYTVDTLRELDAAFPGAELSFIVGGDMAAGLPTWREPAEVVALARLAVAERQGARRADILERLAAIPGAVDRTDFFNLPRMDISSSLVRRRVAAGRTIRYLVPDAVAEYVAEHRLYRSPASTRTA